MIQFEDLSVGQTVYTQIDDEWVEGKINTLIGDRPPNEGRILVEISFVLYGLEIFDVEDLYPSPSFDAAYMMVDIAEPVPDDRTYEFGIGNIGNDDDPYYAATQKTRVTGRRLIVLGKCQGCGGEWPREHLMSASRGTACPDCYDRMSN